MSNNIVLLATDIVDGETVRHVCPTCGGGSDNERSLSITRNLDGTLVWQCFRGKCSEKGGTSSPSTPSLLKMAPPETKRRKVFDDITEPLSAYHLDRIESLWGISEPPHWWWAPTRGRVAMSIRGPRYTHRGWVLRDIWGRPGPKALTYIDEGEEALSWYRNEDPNAPVVIVEDIPSAVRASKYAHAVALLGTRLGIIRAAEIAKYTQGPVIIALDQDATTEAVHHATRYNLLLRDPTVIPLDKDIKNMNDAELRELLGEGE